MNPIRVMLPVVALVFVSIYYGVSVEKGRKDQPLCSTFVKGVGDQQRDYDIELQSRIFLADPLGQNRTIAKTLNLSGIVSLEPLSTGGLSYKIIPSQLSVDGFKESKLDFVGQWKAGLSTLQKPRKPTVALGYLAYLMDALEVSNSENRSGWSTQKSDQVGDFLAHYEYHCGAPPMVSMTKSGYGEESRLGRPTVSGSWRYTVDGEGLISQVRGEDTITIPFSGENQGVVMINSVYLRKSVEKVDFSLAPNLPLSGIKHTKVVKTEDDKVLQEVLSFDGGNQDRSLLILRLKAFAESGDLALKMVLDSFVRLSAEEDAFWMIAESFALMNHPGAAQALLEATDNSVEPNVRSRLQVTLAFSPGANKQVADKYLAWAQDDPKVWSYIGIIGRQSSQRGDAGLGDYTTDLLLNKLKNVHDEEGQLQVMIGVGNAGDSKAMGALEKVLNSDGSLQLKKKALFALRLMDSVKAGELIASYIGPSVSQPLRLEAARALRYSPAISKQEKRKILRGLLSDETLGLTLAREVKRSLKGI